MKTISGYFLTVILGWKINGNFPDVKKSITIFAPHTSYYDALYGKLFLNEMEIRHTILSKKELFFFPMNIAMNLFGSIPVRGINNKNAIYKVVEILNHSKEMHIVISPEGTRAKVTHWNKGFFYMASKVNVPIIVGYIDYKKKEIGIKGVLENLDNVKTVMQPISLMYKSVSAKYPDKFSLELEN
ncbi:MAG TPA: 1-acyl-sn-glycerol-3-phosphate acyltransferase [Candidatus Paceibacterota bacterium]|mgnify:CR=1 FL=1|nr:1-acyl-sn-glycerol-3-phosphate acyltransferase [Candidatus Paceibacterota bacterium]HPS18428.1 1-acyl-sn-glycerol-3-phosphate acyltransferase [Bacteroidales bacterium]